MTQAAMDAGAFAEMKEMMGESFQDILVMSIESLPQQMQAIEDAVRAADAEAIFSSAHKIKSASGAIGAFGLAEKAEAVEVFGRNGLSAVPDDTLQALREAVAQVMALLRAELDSA